MAGIRKGKNPLSVVARRLVAKKRRRSTHNEAPNGKPRRVPRVIEFPKLATADDVVSDWIIFEVGGDRFAIKWTAEIEQLPSAGPVVVERNPLAEIGPFASCNAAAIEAGIQDVRRSRRGTNPVRGDRTKK